MIILGAGMAGCIAGIVNPTAKIFEAQRDTARNHRAVLRFRGEEISKVTGIPFKKVKVYKGIWYEGKHHPLTPLMISLYSQKVIGYITDRSISNLNTAERYIAPTDFHAQLIDILGNRILFEHKIENINEIDSGRTVISTLPMNVLAKIVGVYLESEFHFQKIISYRYKVNDCNLYATIYYPGKENMYRATLTGHDLIVESINNLDTDDIDTVLNSFGINHLNINTIGNSYTQKYGKILEIDDSERKNFIYDMSVNNNIFSLGRFATWRNILLDDVLNDLYVIRGLISKGLYDRSKSI